MNYLDNKKLTVINIWGGPGAGKSLNAAGLFHQMKKEYIPCELVTEYAKDLVWSERGPMFTEQDYIFAKQNHRLRRLAGKIKFAIIDSPLPTSLMYMPPDFPESFSSFVMDVWKSYTNINFLLERHHPYEEVGRNQNEAGAKAIDRKIEDFLKAYNILFIRVPTSDDTAGTMFQVLQTMGVFNDYRGVSEKKPNLSEETA